MSKLSQTQIGSLADHRRLLQYVIGEEGFDPQGRRLLAETEAVIGSIIFLDQLQLAVPHIERVETFRAKGAHGDGIHASSLFAATDALKAILAGNDPLPPPFAPPAPIVAEEAVHVEASGKDEAAAPPQRTATDNPPLDRRGCSLNDVWPPETDTDSLIDFYKGDRHVPPFHLAYGPEKKAPEIMVCTRCDGKVFHVAQGDDAMELTYTAIRCKKCKWEMIIHSGLR